MKPMTQIAVSNTAGNHTASATLPDAAFRRLNQYPSMGAPAESTSAVNQSVVTIGPAQGSRSCQLSMIQPNAITRIRAISRSIAAPMIRNARNTDPPSSRTWFCDRSTTFHPPFVACWRQLRQTLDTALCRAASSKPMTCSAVAAFTTPEAITSTHTPARPAVSRRAALRGRRAPAWRSARRRS